MSLFKENMSKTISREMFFGSVFEYEDIHTLLVASKVNFQNANTMRERNYIFVCISTLKRLTPAVGKM